MNSHPLGSKENPHPYKWGEKGRIKNHHYFNKEGEVRYWNGKQFKYRHRMKKYYMKNREKILKAQSDYAKTEKGRAKRKSMKTKETRRKYYRKRMKEDKIFRLIRCLRTRLQSALKTICKKNSKIIVGSACEERTMVTGFRHSNDKYKYKNKRTTEYLMCSPEKLCDYLECQFESWMTWDNRGVYKINGPRTWQSDHRRPCDTFDFNDEEQIYMCFHWTNHQPLCSKVNVVEKNSKFDPETFRYKWMGREIGWVGIPSYLMKKKHLAKQI